MGPMANFNDCIQEATLVECSFNGSKYNWCNDNEVLPKNVDLIELLLNVHWNEKFDLWVLAMIGNVSYDLFAVLMKGFGSRPPFLVFSFYFY